MQIIQINEVPQENRLDVFPHFRTPKSKAVAFTNEADVPSLLPQSGISYLRGKQISSLKTEAVLPCDTEVRNHKSLNPRDVLHVRFLVVVLWENAAPPAWQLEAFLAFNAILCPRSMQRPSHAQTSLSMSPEDISHLLCGRSRRMVHVQDLQQQKLPKRKQL